VADSKAEGWSLDPAELAFRGFELQAQKLVLRFSMISFSDGTNPCHGFL
jgi:hypothetical protein